MQRHAVLLALVAAAFAVGVAADCSDMGDVDYLYAEGGTEVEFWSSGNCMTIKPICVPDEPPLISCPAAGPWPLSLGTMAGGFNYHIVHNTTGAGSAMGGTNVYRLLQDPTGAAEWASTGLFEATFVVNEYSGGARVGRARLVQSASSPLRAAAGGTHVEGCLDWEWLDAPAGDFAAYPATSAYGPMCFRAEDECCSGEQKPNRFGAAVPGTAGFLALWGSNGDPSTGKFEGHTAGIDLGFQLHCPSDAPIVAPTEDVTVRIFARLPDDSGNLPHDEYQAQYKSGSTWVPITSVTGGGYTWTAPSGTTSVRVRILVNGLASAQRTVSLRDAGFGALIVEHFQLVLRTVRLDSSEGVEFSTDDYAAAVKVGSSYVPLALIDGAYRTLVPGALNLRHRVTHNGRSLDVTSRATPNLPNNEAELRVRTVKVVVRVLRADGTEVPASQYEADFKHASWELMDLDEDLDCFMFNEQLVPVNVYFRVRFRGSTSASQLAKLSTHTDHMYEVVFQLVQARVRLQRADGASFVADGDFEPKERIGSTYEPVPLTPGAGHVVDALPNRIYFGVSYAGEFVNRRVDLKTEHSGDFIVTIVFRLVALRVELRDSDGALHPVAAYTAAKYRRELTPKYPALPVAGDAYGAEILPVRSYTGVTFEGIFKNRRVDATAAGHGGTFAVTEVWRTVEVTVKKNADGSPVATGDFAAKYYTGSAGGYVPVPVVGGEYKVQQLETSNHLRVTYDGRTNTKKFNYADHTGYKFTAVFN